MVPPIGTFPPGQRRLSPPEENSLSPATGRGLPKLLRVLWRLTTSLIAVALLPACGADTVDSGLTSPSPQAATTSTATPVSKTWVDLEVGDCIAGIPRVDLVSCARN